MIKTEAQKFDLNSVQYKTTSEWRKHKTILEERIKCLEICNECFTYEDVNCILFHISLIFSTILFLYFLRMDYKKNHALISV